MAASKSTAARSSRSTGSASGKSGRSTAGSRSSKGSKAASAGKSTRSSASGNANNTKKSKNSKSTSANGRQGDRKVRNNNEEMQRELERREEFRREVILWGLVAVSLLLFISNLGFGGVVGGAVSSILFGVFGLTAYVVPILLLFGSVFYYVNRGNALAARILFSSAFLIFFICMFISLLVHGADALPPVQEYFYSVKNKFGGGFLGGCFSWLFSNAFGLAGAYIIDVIGMIICLVLITGRSAMRGMARGGQKVVETAQEVQQERQERRDRRSRSLRMNRKVSGVTYNTRIMDENEDGNRDENANGANLTGEDASEMKQSANRDSGRVRRRTSWGRNDAPEAQNAENMPYISDMRSTTDARNTSGAQDSGKADLQAAAGKNAGNSGSGRRLGYSGDGLQELYANPNVLADELEQKLSYMESQEARRNTEAGAGTESGTGVGSGSGTGYRSGKSSGTGISGGSNPDSLQELTAYDDADADELLQRYGMADSIDSAQQESDRKSRRNAKSRPGTNVMSQPGTSGTDSMSQSDTNMDAQQELMDDLPSHTDAEAPVEAPEYIIPPTSLLTEPKQKAGGNNTKDLRETAQKLQTTLDTFGVKVAVTDVSCGPTVTRYEIQPEAGVKVSKIVNLADDIKLNLAAADIRIEAPIPGKAAVGIEVPNKENVTVPFRELVESEEFRNSKSKISFAVGKDISGKPVVADIAKMPHVLIAGATGSGKSVCINTIIMSVLFHAKPDEVKLILIDPKVVELNVYRGIPHLMIDVVTDPKKAAAALNWAVEEMTERYQKFADAGVRKLEEYNEKVDSITVPEGQEKPKKMPQILIVVDELADLMMVASREVEDAICRLAQLARAAGLHLVIATQRPSVNVITGLIKANMPSRIAFAVTSGVDSRTILDMNGAEKLLGKGDMLFYPQGLPKPVRVQGALVSDEEVSRVVAYIKEQNGPVQYSATVQQKMTNYETGGGQSVAIHDVEPDDGRDAYFIEAARVVVDKEKASIGMFQRAFKIGFNRAARIMDQLEEAGIVGPEVGTKPRNVLMSAEELQEFIDANE